MQHLQLLIMLLISGALWHGIAGGISVAFMYAAYYSYKGIRHLIKNPDEIKHALNSIRKTTRQIKAELTMKTSRKQTSLQKISRPRRSFSLPKPAKKIIVGLGIIACLAGSCFGLYKLLDDVIIPSRNTRKDLHLIKIAQDDPQLADSIACILHNTHHYCNNSNNSWHEQQAIQLLLIGARAGDVSAQLHLGKWYESGYGYNWQDPLMDIRHTKHYEKTSGSEYNKLQHAVYWFKEASDAGNMEARGRLGFLYYFGNGCEYLPMAGERMIKEAADSGLSQFQYLYGNLLEKGLTGYYAKGDEEYYFRTDPRIDLAKKYWQLAAKQGNEKAKLKLEKVY